MTSDYEFWNPKLNPSTVAFFEPSPDRARSRGTGTFVTVGKVHGILTCAHVIDAIYECGTVLVAVYPVRPMTRFLPLDAMQYCDRIKFGPVGGDAPPDLGFLKLPMPFVNQISHLVSFHNLLRGRDDAFATLPQDQDCKMVLAGIVDEAWGPEPHLGNTPHPNGLLSFGCIEEEETISGYDRLRFLPDPYEDFSAPASYGGTSGGGLWEVCRSSVETGDLRYRLLGVAYFETGEDPNRILCHGRQSIYVKLLDQICQKWSDEI